MRVPAAEFGPQGETQTYAYVMHRTDEHLGPAARTFCDALLRMAGHRTVAINANPLAPGYQDVAAQSVTRFVCHGDLGSPHKDPPGLIGDGE